MFQVVYNEGFVSADTSPTILLLDRLVTRHRVSPGTNYVLEFYDLDHIEALLRHVAEKRICASDISLTVKGKRVTIEEDGTTPTWQHPLRNPLPQTDIPDASDQLRPT